MPYTLPCKTLQTMTTRVFKKMHKTDHAACTSLHLTYLSKNHISRSLYSWRTGPDFRETTSGPGDVATVVEWCIRAVSPDGKRFFDFFSRPGHYNPQYDG